MHSHMSNVVSQEIIQNVLILVVMEDALAPKKKQCFIFLSKCLNPCCNGRCTRTMIKVVRQLVCLQVLILVVMEDALAH